MTFRPTPSWVRLKVSRLRNEEGRVLRPPRTTEGGRARQSFPGRTRPASVSIRCCGVAQRALAPPVLVPGPPSPSRRPTPTSRAHEEELVPHRPDRAQALLQRARRSADHRDAPRTKHKITAPSCPVATYSSKEHDRAVKNESEQPASIASSLGAANASAAAERAAPAAPRPPRARAARRGSESTWHAPGPVRARGRARPPKRAWRRADNSSSQRTRSSNATTQPSTTSRSPSPNARSTSAAPWTSAAPSPGHGECERVARSEQPELDAREPRRDAHAPDRRDERLGLAHEGAPAAHVERHDLRARRGRRGPASRRRRP